MHRPPTQTGFTLVEMIVSLAIFAIVATVSIGALLVLVGTNQRLQGEQSVMTNLSFALDSMTREIRTGSAYFCTASASDTGAFYDGSNLDSVHPLTATSDCAAGSNGARFRGLSFVEGGDSISSGTGQNRIFYYFDNNEKTLYRKVGTTELPIVSPEIVIEEFEFFVTGSDTQRSGGSGANRQPTVTIYIKATEKGATTDKPYYIQTTVTQRTLDV